jgi:hypothetical protein
MLHSPSKFNQRILPRSSQKLWPKPPRVKKKARRKDSLLNRKRPSKPILRKDLMD